MKTNILRGVFSIVAGAAVCFSLGSCEDYLDKAPESDISEETAFKNFTNFQGFVEEMFNAIPMFDKGYWNNSWNWGEDEILADGINYMMGYKIDNGDFWGWQSEHDGWQSGFMDRTRFSASSDDRFTKSLVPACWYGIRKANLGLENLEYFTDGTAEERNIIEGELYFFRGWFHFQLMQYFGGIPYIDEVLPAGEKLTLPRLSYAECAEKAAADLQKAADLLPIDWDKTTVGVATTGQNGLRVNKITALAYLGKDLLWAASPLMSGGTSAGTYSYDADFASRAADALGSLISLVESGQTQYALVDFANISDVFYSYNKGGLMPGSTEAIFRSPLHGDWNCTNWGLSVQFSGDLYTNGGATAPYIFPTANYVNYYGMANGLPLDDPDSGFDKAMPWKDRDPRFYSDIKYDGAEMTINPCSKNGVNYKYANFTSGEPVLRNVKSGTRTGYMLGKFIPTCWNHWDDDRAWGKHFFIHIPWLRLSEVYLLYAEAVDAAKGNATATSSTCSISALDAVNTIRRRAGVTDVNAKYSGDKDKFMDEVRRERAVELAYEGHRFNDLRRWCLLDKYPYNIKTSQEFIRKDYNSNRDPKLNKVSDFRQEVILTRNFSSKHYWLPLKVSDVTLYPEFGQNPGW